MIDGVIVAVKEISEDLENRLKREYGNFTTIYQIDNTQGEGICAKYNLGIEKIINDKQTRMGRAYSDLGLPGETSSEYTWTVFAHDDAVLKSNNLNQSLSCLLRAGADVVGVAGNVSIPSIEKGYWWDGLVEGKFKGSGAVIHRTPDTKGMFHIESYGPYPQQVSSLDGVWIAVKTSCLLNNNNLRFDEDTFKGYHYYDADFCAKARSLGLKIWVGDILVLHDKWGRGVEDPEFHLAQKLFVNKWSKQKHLYYKGQPSPSKNPFISKTVAFK